MRVLTFDLEIKNVIDGKLIGWKDYDKMGISVGVAHDSLTNDFKVYMDDNIHHLGMDLENADIVTGFNIKGFDIPLLEAVLGRQLQFRGMIYDILEHSRNAVGLRQFAKGLKLDNHLEATFGSEGMKTAHGAEAPIMWQEKRIGELISYCIRDVSCEKRLFNHIALSLPVKTEMHGEKKLRSPIELWVQHRAIKGETL